MCEMNDELKIVNWRIHDVNDQFFGKAANDRASSKVVTCSMSHKCQAYAMGKCATFGFMRRSCSYARFDNRQGFTRRARGYRKWLADQRDRVKDVPQLSPVDHICEIGDFIYFPYKYWTYDKTIECDKREGWASSGDIMIPKARFTVDYFNQIVNATIRRLDTEVGAKNFPTKVRPKMVADVKRYAPGFYKEWADKFPESADSFKVSYVGRKAIISTMKPCEWTDDKGVHYQWDGDTVKVSGHEVGFSKVIGDTVFYIVKPSGTATMVVTCDSQVNDETIIK